MIALAVVAISIALVFYFFNRWEKELIEKRMNTCREYASRLAREVEASETIRQQLSGLLDVDRIYMESSRRADDLLTRMVESGIAEVEGLEGGFYVVGLNDFIGYAFPTSEPPVPVYGPPPRSYNIIKDQAIESIEKGEPIVDVHAFDPAIFPLATHPFSTGQKVTGAVWVRIHIERDLPVAKLKRILNFFTIVFLVGFVVMAMFTFFLRSGIRSIRKELDNTRKDPGSRLKHRGGWFGFIPRSINGMLDLIEKEYKHRQKLERELQQKEKLATLGKMIAGVAHEVKTPLSVIKTRMQMWQHEVEKNARLQEKVDTGSINMVINEINRVSDLVRRLHVFSRPIYENLQPTSIDRVIEEVVSLMDFESSGCKVRVRKILKENPPPVNADGNSLKQVLINIYSNSIESIEDGGDILTETVYDEAGSVMHIRISDTGSGIPAEKMDSVFDPFFTTKETGTGLGLTISHEIISSHGGTISFRENEPKGTICIVTLPLIN